MSSVLLLPVYHFSLQGKVTVTQDVKERGRYLVENFNFEAGDTKKIWCFGPNGSGPNMLIDTSKSVQYLQEIRDTVVAGFQWASQEVCRKMLTAKGGHCS